MFYKIKNIIINNIDFIFKSLLTFLLIILFITFLNVIYTFSLYPTLNKTLDKLGKNIENNINKTLPEHYFQTNDKIERKRIILSLILEEVEPFKEEIGEFFCK